MSNSSIVNLSTARLDLAVSTRNSLRLERYGSAGHNWLHERAASGLFAVYSKNQRLDASSGPLRGGQIIISTPAAGIKEWLAVVEALPLHIQHHMRIYDDAALTEQWQTVHNLGVDPIHIDRLDSFSLNIPADTYQLSSFNSDWGQEFEPVDQPLADKIILETRAGRSSKSMHPWFALTAGDGSVLTGSVAWSANWIFRFEPLAGGFQLSGGLSDWEFAIDLAPGASIQTPKVILAAGPNLNASTQQYHDIGRRYWYPRNALSESIPVEWNPWWSYEDIDINEAVFRHNGQEAARLGIELCTLDAGWFGPNNETHWHDYRGDWALVNTRRFPQGIRTLSDAIHTQGMKFGLWCEIEGLGSQAQLAVDHPDYPALRDGLSLGYVCLANPSAAEWAYQTLCRLIAEYNCDWLKLDFNVDPGSGCNRTDHGHGSGDGLYHHVYSYYSVLDRIRERFPAVILENCSSGGLRIDLEMARHTHVTFTSDPDWPTHALQVFWGVSHVLAPDVCLRWSYSEWRNSTELQTFDPFDPALNAIQFDYLVRIAMLSWPGFSQKLLDLPAWLADRLAQHVVIYKSQVRRFIRKAVLTCLTGQPRRSGEGERWAAFQYHLVDSSELLLFVFRLPNAEPQKTIFLQGLQPDRRYLVEPLTIERRTVQSISGADLIRNGLNFTALQEQESALLWIHTDE